MVGLISAVGVCACLGQLLVAQRATPAGRRSWRLSAVWSLLIALTEVAMLKGGPGWAPAELLRLIAMPLLIVSLLSAPGVTRRARQWVPVLMDGALLTASAMCVLWVGLAFTNVWSSPRPAPLLWSVLWIPMDVLGVAAVLGLALRADPQVRRGVSLACVTAICGLLSDVFWARTTHTGLAALLAAVAIAALTFSAMASGRNSWCSVQPDGRTPLPAVKPHLAAVPGLLAAVLAPHRNLLVILCATVLVVLVMVRLADLDRINYSLWDRLHQRATTDDLTGLLNRSAFLNELRQGLKRGSVSVLFMDLDGFKEVNDAQGHVQGDDVLRRTARHVRQNASPTIMAARLGGDEFALAFTGGQTDQAEQTAGKIMQRLAGDPQCLGVGASLGLARGHQVEAEALLRDADLAMYAAKQSGGNRCLTFEPWMSQRLRERSGAETGLRAALQNAFAAERKTPALAGGHAGDSRLELDLQPVVALPSGDWTGFEALVRWRDQGSRHQPAEFLPLAAQVGLMNDVGLWVLRSALRWLAAQDTSLGIAVNAVGSQITDPHFTTLVISELERAGVEPGRLTLDVTEQTPVQHLLLARRVLAPLRELGVHVALDDFGTGFSSLRYLSQLPVDVLKIDPSFVAGLGHSNRSDAVVKTVLLLGKDLGLQVIAEGVETAQQRSHLQMLECPAAQGFLYSRPLQADHLDLRALAVDPSCSS